MLLRSSFYFILFLILSCTSAASLRKIVPVSKSVAKRTFSEISKKNINTKFLLPIGTKKNLNFNLNEVVTNSDLCDEDVMNMLIRGPLPENELRNAQYFTDAVMRGNHQLCYQLLRNGQKIQLFDEEGNNLLVRLIEMKMSYLIGTLMETNHDLTLLAIGLKDAKTGHTPLSKAILLSDLIAILEISNPRQQRL